MMHTARYMVRFRSGVKSSSSPETDRPGRVPRITRLLALSHDIERRIRAGELDDLAHAARILGLTRARVTQIAGLTLLAPEIQEEILAMPPISQGRDPITERGLREIVAEANWEHQWVIWKDVSRALRGRE